jgi:diguanylate cyclase (GGDEF)-like protein
MKSLRALLIEDREDDALLLLNLLKRGGYVVSHHRVESIPELNKAMLTEWDIIFCDHSLPKMNGIDALSIVRKLNADTPFVFVSGTIREELAVEAMRTGAQDYIMKDNMKRLIPAVQREISEAKVRKKRHEAEQRLLYLAHYDRLTELPNRFTFLQKLNQILAASTRNSVKVFVVYIDIDRFKTVNDSLGYDAGNQVLVKVAQRLTNCLGNKGVVARLAADEFALLLTENSFKGDAEQFFKTVLHTISIPFTIHDWSLHFSASIGVAVYPDDADDAIKLLGNADIATYRAKDEGGNRIQFYRKSMAVQLNERLSLERLMRFGIEKQEFCLHYQPQIDFATNAIVGVEALLRWNNTERGPVSPATFIPLSEDTGFILPLGRWVLKQACAQIKEWQQSCGVSIRVAVNVSARQFHEENLTKLITETLQEYELEPRYLELEITETSIIRDAGKAIQTLNEIKALGVKVALDDFGTGYSSLSYLKRFKTDYLKIDQSFISELPGDKDEREIVSAIIAMAEKLSMQTIAEGVETEEQYKFLKDQGCDIAQGYFLGRPMAPEKMELILKEKGNFF